MGKQEISYDRYSIIPRCLIFLNRDDSILFIKGAPGKKLWPNLYNGIGGHIEKGEDIFSAAHREIFEETGLRPESLYLCGIIIIDTNKKLGIGIFVFKGNCSQGETTPSSEGELHWIGPDELNELDLVEDLPILLPKVLNWQPHQLPFSALYQYQGGDNKLQIKFFE